MLSPSTRCASVGEAARLVTSGRSARWSLGRGCWPRFAAFARLDSLDLLDSSIKRIFSLLVLSAPSYLLNRPLRSPCQQKVECVSLALSDSPMSNRKHARKPSLNRCEPAVHPDVYIYRFFAARTPMEGVKRNCWLHYSSKRQPNAVFGLAPWVVGIRATSKGHHPYWMVALLCTRQTTESCELVRKMVTTRPKRSSSPSLMGVGVFGASFCRLMNVLLVLFSSSSRYWLPLMRILA